MNQAIIASLGKRILILGVSASGKSTFARTLAKKIGLPLTHVDAIMWQPGWQYIGDEATAAKLHEIGAGEEWIIEGYIEKGSRSYLFERADTIIYLDYPRIVATLRYLKRWLKHRKHSRPELENSPDKFDWDFMKLVWRKGESWSVNKFLAQMPSQDKLIKLTSLKATKTFLKNI
jgi:adenylate kinase family enzyme